MPEIWEKEGGLIPAKEWDRLIESFKTKKEIITKTAAKEKLRDLIISSIKKRIPAKTFGILFSGGVDSSLIAALCKKEQANFICYTVGFQDKLTKEPEDIAEAKQVAKKLGFNLKYKIYDLKEAKEVITNTVEILKKVNKIDPVNVGVGVVVLAAITLAKKQGIDYFMSGLGSEELFAGYERHSKVVDVNEECWHGLREIWGRDLVRDFYLAKALNVKIKTPFLDEELIKFAMSLPGEWKLDEKEKKIILREVAQELLGEFAWRKKKAAQYGSGFDKAMIKLAKKEGYDKKSEWLGAVKLSAKL